MCLIAAYAGPAIPLENIIVRPTHSLLTQSQHATEAKLAVNGDGFGIAWYAEGIETPGLYRDVLPAWADGNLVSLCRMVRAPLFLSHIRASTMGETSRANCHPFAHGRWSFCHNGQVPHIARIRRRIEAALPDSLYHARRGTTDSELVFLMLLANGLDTDPGRAIAATLSALGPEAPDGPVRLTCVLSDGHRLLAFRHASDGQCPTLYLSGRLDNGGRAIASEPLEDDRHRWHRVPEGVLLDLADGQATERPFAALAAA
ncbi:class II glutamine amidotransferase [Oceaniglobus roseus]|uniref:class II glutamine amidotransferase n=1 Tax=Oceaniglobus roseus TaxID=1737570 RepID=UPI000C7F31D9|nr:class II glutamine amidotransferase [Kandeliimicrobium roseum]